MWKVGDVKLGASKEFLAVNYLAFFIAIVTDKSVSQSLVAMRIIPESNLGGEK